MQRFRPSANVLSIRGGSISHFPASPQFGKRRCSLLFTSSIILSSSGTYRYTQPGQCTQCTTVLPDFCVRLVPLTLPSNSNSNFEFDTHSPFRFLNDSSAPEPGLRSNLLGLVVAKSALCPRLKSKPVLAMRGLCAHASGPTDAHDRRSPGPRKTEAALPSHPTDQRATVAFRVLAWHCQTGSASGSPVWVLPYWLGILSTSHVHSWDIRHGSEPSWRL